MEKHIDYNMVINVREMAEKIRRLEEEIERCDGYVCLTDAFSKSGQGGQLALFLLDPTSNEVYSNVSVNSTWKIRCLKHEDGTAVQPGDKIIRKIRRPWRTRAGTKMRSREINKMIISGEFEERFVETRSFDVDDNCCITCGYEDAGWFLTSFGVHYKTGFGICGRREVSGGGGRGRARFNWRFVECPPWGLDESRFPLPEKPKRGK